MTSLFSTALLAAALCAADEGKPAAESQRPAQLRTAGVSPTLKITRRPICPGDQPVSVRPVHRVSLRPDAVDVRRAGFRRQFRGRAALSRRLPPGDRPPRKAVVSRRRRTPRRVHAGCRPAVQRQACRSASGRSRATLHAGHLAGRQVRHGRRAAAVLALPAAERRVNRRSKWRSGARAGPTPPPSSGRREQWQRFEADLTPDADRRRTPTLTISFRGPGTLWIDQVSLMPADNVFGWRRDVAEALKALKPGIIRFGGSTIEGFDWTATIGDPAQARAVHHLLGRTGAGQRRPGGVRATLPLGRGRAADLRPLHRQERPRTPPTRSSISTARPTSPMGKLRRGQRPRRAVPRPVLADRQRAGRRDLSKRRGRLLQGDEGRRSRASSCWRRFPRRACSTHAGQYCSTTSARTITACQNLPAMEDERGAVPPDDRRKRPRPRHPPGHYRVEHDGRRLGPAPGDALDARQRPVVQPLPQLHAPPLRPDRDRQPQQPGRQLLQRHHPDQQPRPVQDADLLCPATLRQPCRAARRWKSKTAPAPRPTIPRWT